MNNQDIRIAILQANLKHYQIANKLGIQEESFSRKLRYELAESEKFKVLNAIEELKKEKKED